MKEVLMFLVKASHIHHLIILMEYLIYLIVMKIIISHINMVIFQIMKLIRT